MQIPAVKVMGCLYHVPSRVSMLQRDVVFLFFRVALFVVLDDRLSFPSSLLAIVLGRSRRRVVWVRLFLRFGDRHGADGRSVQHGHVHGRGLL